VKLIKAEDRKGIDEAITNAAVEQKVLERLRLKAKTYGTDPDLEANGSGLGKINVEAVVAMYKVGRFPDHIAMIEVNGWLGLCDSAYQGS